jgi:hypothetical protein
MDACVRLAGRDRNRGSEEEPTFLRKVLIHRLHKGRRGRADQSAIAGLRVRQFCTQRGHQRLEYLIPRHIRTLLPPNARHTFNQCRILLIRLYEIIKTCKKRVSHLRSLCHPLCRSRKRSCVLR